jgi:segregation and condensation protein A
MSGVLVHIDHFSGPMALLLHLIRKEEMDIFDININEITSQYLSTIKSMNKLNLEVAGDFVAMAATLIQIKSKMLLPQYNENGEVVETEDPRKELVKRLVEYQMFQDASKTLYQRPLLGRDVWTRGTREDFRSVEDDGIVMEEENALYALMSAYRMAVKNMKKAVHKVTESLQSISDRIWEMRRWLRVGHETRMSEMIIGTENRIPQVLITFLSLLEMAKIGIVTLFQSENFADIHIQTKKEVTIDAISNVENYEAQVHAPMAAGITEVNVSELNLDSEVSTPQMELSEMNFTENTDVAVAADPLVAAATVVSDPGFVIESATDEDIFNEEKRLFGEVISENKKEQEPEI